MFKFIKILFLSFFILVYTNSCDKLIKNKGDKFWKLDLKLNHPKLYPEAVQFAIFDYDPEVKFSKTIKQNIDYYKSLYKNIKDSTEIKSLSNSTINLYWDMCFEDITGSNVYLLTPSTFTIGSNELEGKKWIVTKIVFVDNKPVCWCIPVNLKFDKSIEIELTPSNKLNIEKSFFQIIGIK